MQPESVLQVLSQQEDSEVRWQMGVGVEKSLQLSSVERAGRLAHAAAN
jgi:hypothetical protein